jgi:undecaprenyl-diphosphatase
VTFPERRGLATASAVLLLSGYAVLTLFIIAGMTQSVDDAWYRLMVRLEWAPAVAVATAFDVIGGTWVTLPIRIGVPVLLAVQRRWTALVLWLLVLVPVQSISIATKVLVDRPRPPLPLVETVTASYPSGHTTNAAAITLGLVFVFTTPGTRPRKMAVVVGVLFMLAMAWSRTYLRAHWLSDVDGGLLLGVGGALLAWALVSLWRRRKRRT